MSENRNTRQDFTDEISRLRERVQDFEIYRRLLDSLPLGLTICKQEDPDDLGSIRFLASNPAGGEAAGVPVEAYVGKTIGESFPGLLETDMPRLYAEAIRTQRTQTLPQVRYGDEKIPESIWEVKAVPLGGPTFAIVFENIAERVRADQELRESARRYRSLYDHTPVMMHAIDHEGRLINVNQGWLDTLGYERSEVIGRRSTDFLTDASRRYAIEVALPEFWRTGSAAEVEYQMVKGNGEAIDVLLSAVAETDESGEVTQSLAFLVDVTERKRAEEALSYQAHLLENVNDAVIASDERFVTTAWNRAAEEMYGWAAEEIIGRPTAEFLQPEFVDVEPDEVFRRLLEEGHFEGEVIHPRKDGARIHTEARATALRDKDGRITGFVSIDRDITDRKRAEEERKVLIAELEGKNAELEQFTYTVSHDLRSPLITIKGFLGRLAQDADAGDAERMRADMDRIAGAAEHMKKLLDELLELSRVGRVLGASEEMPLGDVAREAVALIEGQATERDVKVTIATGLPLVYGDRHRVREVLQNLIENAIKFTGEQPSPQVEVGARREDGETVCYVRDNGMGIDPRYHGKVFDLFDQLNQTKEGMGLGLALVKRIAEVHGGRVWVESEGLGHGSTFCFTLRPNTQGLDDEGAQK